MQERFYDNYPLEQNQIIFRTLPGARFIPAGEIVRLNDGLPNGIPVANFRAVRLYARCRPGGTVPVTFSVFILDVEEDELIYRLDRFVLEPQGEDYTRIFEIPGRALVVFAQAGPGTGGTAIDFGVLGFGPLYCCVCPDRPCSRCVCPECPCGCCE